MKIVLDGYEVDVRARVLWKPRASKRDTMDFLNFIALVLTESAADWDGSPNMQKLRQKQGHELYELLKAEGCYD